MVLQAIAEGVVTNYPESDLMILLVDERPEEVTEMENSGSAR
jgi:transcription termination factor Rho